MSTDKKHAEPSSADLEAELAAIDENLDAENAALAKLDEAIVSGSDFDPGERPKRRNVIEILRDRRINLAARKAKAERRERLEKLAALRALIEAEEADDAETIRAQGVAAIEAARTFLASCRARDERLHAHRRTLSQLNVPEHAFGTRPSPDHAEVGWTTHGELALGTSRLKIPNGPQLLDRAIAAAKAESTGSVDAVRDLAKIEAELAELRTTVHPVQDARYFVNRAGSVLAFGPDGPGESASGLKEITADEAERRFWEQNEKRSPVSQAARGV